MALVFVLYLSVLSYCTTLIVVLLRFLVYEWSKHTVHFLVEKLKHNHSSFNISQTYKTALILGDVLTIKNITFKVLMIYLHFSHKQLRCS